MLLVDGSSVLCSWQGTQRRIRVSMCLGVLGTHSSTTAVQRTAMLLVLFPSWSTECIHKSSLGSKLKLSSFSIKEIYHFPSPSSSEYCFRKSISATSELMKKEKVASFLPAWVLFWACESLITSLSLHFREGLKRMGCFPIFLFTFP